ncbi:hypothetical protein SCLARK_001753 [Spiroplasma clarkii]|uniref:hypothetical protein n=1 Tax=Spiroplasma clarkii TaxID=2139 RepID=UPI000B566415|nr:hypothetical protein [Spiroplasma clarkii]ARU92206.1 hypothetical protein SCLARK_001753 [Spiroplasma clarkii]
MWKNGDGWNVTSSFKYSAKIATENGQSIVKFSIVISTSMAEHSSCSTLKSNYAVTINSIDIN